MSALRVGVVWHTRHHLAKLEGCVVSWLPKTCVIVPFDFSELSVQALETARDLVDDPTHLHVIHVLAIITISEPGIIWDAIDNETCVRHAAKSFREEFATSPFHSVDFNVRFGDPGREIAAFAEQCKADLIVMPSHGRSGLGRLLIGSVAERTVRLAHCPVLILKSRSVSAASPGVDAEAP
jgi:nucleotide-binding universal stress UspA family protein